MKKGFLLFLTFLVLVSCKKDPETTPVSSVDNTPKVRVELQPFFGDSLLQLDQAFTLSDGTRIQLTDIKFYATNIGNGATIVKDVALFNYRDRGVLFFQSPGNYNLFSLLRFNVGVPSTINHNDPSAFPTANDLNIAIANDMHWSWNPGYIFIKLEAKADTLQDGIDNFNLAAAYHVGLDANFDSIQFPVIQWTQTNSLLHTAKLKLNVKTIFDHPTTPINIKTDNFTHSNTSQAALTATFKSNFISSISAQ